jgi:hypothetical protein
MALDSEASFASRLRDLRLEPFAELITAAGWGTAGSFAFSCNYSPGMTDETSFVNTVVIPILGAADHPLKASLKRLHFESYTLMVSEMKRKVERVEDDAPRRLPMPERDARRDRQARELVGLSLTGEFECAHGLIDKAVQMMEDDIIRYLPVDECSKREQEMNGEKKDKELKTDSRGFVRETSVNAKVIADTTSDLRLKNAFIRRGLAFDQAQVMAFATHEKLVSLLFTEYMRDPPIGFRKVSQDQMMRADREVFRRLQELTRKGIRPAADGARPIDAAMQGVLDCAAVQMLLLPLAEGSGGGKREREQKGPVDANQPKSKAAKKNAKKKSNMEELNKFRKDAAAPKAAKGAAKGERHIALPRELIGNTAVTSDGKNLCFSFNMAGGCSSAETARGARCNKGWHLCCKPGCGAPHPLGEHVS